MAKAEKKETTERKKRGSYDEQVKVKGNVLEILQAAVKDANKNVEYTEQDHLADKELVVKEIYDRLIKELQKFGQVKIEPKKTSIHLANRYGFAGIYTRKNYINLELHLSRRLNGERIAKVEQASANRFHHTIKLSSIKDVDKELLTWLEEAYDIKK